MAVSCADELGEGTVFRLAKVTDEFRRDSSKPLAEHFRPTPDDRKIAAATGKPVRLSVFDLVRTTVRQAREMRRTGGETISFGLRVEEVRSIQIPGTSRSLRVIRDPFGEIELPDSPELEQLRADLAKMAEMPGADGHCGIEGVGDDICQNTRDRKNLRAMLLRKSFRIAEA